MGTREQLGYLHQQSSKESNSMRLSRSFNKSTSLSEIDPLLETKMNAMVKELVYGSLGRKVQSRISSDRPAVQNHHVSGESSSKAIGAIHERVAAALASVLMSKTLPNLSSDKNKS